MTDDLHYHTMTELAPRLRSGELSPVALTEALLARIRQLNPALNAFRLIDEARALAAAHAAERQIRAGLYLGPLHGIPYATKDLFDVQGLPTAAGSKTLEHNIADADATVTRKLAQAGMILLGKTNTVEFAFGSVGINHGHGTPHNPWRQTHHVPGGSSSGSAVAVAAGLVPFGTGSDTACSVRTPAALCGVVGLKTTVGRISRSGVFPLSPTLDSVGPLTRSVADAALAFSALQGSDPGDPTTLGVDAIDVLSTLDDGVDGLRLAIPGGAMVTDLDPEVETAVRAGAALLRSLGARVDEDFAFPQADQALALPVSPSLVEGYMLNAERLDTQLELIDPVVRERMLPGGRVRAVDYAKTLHDMAQLRAASRHTLRNVDALLVPTTRIAARELSIVDASTDSYLRFANDYVRNCIVGNLLDLCAVSVPCGLTKNGLPIGLMIYAKPFAEAMALRVAQAFEQNSDWCQRRPNLDWIPA